MDRNSPRARAGLTLGLLSVAAIHATSALMPLVYPIVIGEFGLDAGDIGTFIAIGNALPGARAVTA